MSRPASSAADADATWRTTVDGLQSMLEEAAEADLADFFEFRPPRVVGSTPD